MTLVLDTLRIPAELPSGLYADFGNLEFSAQAGFPVASTR